MPLASGGVGGSIFATGDREMPNVLGAPADAGGMPRVWSISDSRIAPDTSLDLVRRGAGIRGYGEMGAWVGRQSVPTSGFT